jgi:hypothetical protein
MHILKNNYLLFLYSNLLYIKIKKSRQVAGFN